MVPRCIILFAMTLSLPAVAVADFHKIYDNAADKRITILTLHGDIKLSGYDGKSIDISAVKKGPDRDRVEIEDASFGNHIHIFPRYLEPERNNATVDFEIRVPKEIFYNAGPAIEKPSKPQEKSPDGRTFSPRPKQFPGETPKPPMASIPPKTPPGALPHTIYLKSNSGQITISDVAGSIRAETGGRNIEVQNVEGMLYVSSVSGDIRGLLKQTSRRSVLQFSSISGNISVQAPDDISAQVRIQSSTGQVKTDFSLEVRDMRYGPGRSIQGKLGDGNHVLNIRSVSGAINFFKKPPETKSK